MDQIDKTLIDFGLTQNEAKVYRQILLDGETSPFQLARETGIPRTTIYEIVSDLSFKGIIELERSDGFSKQQTKLRAKNPSTLRQIIRDRRLELAKLDVRITDILPGLKEDFHKADPHGFVQFFPGIEGAKKVYRYDLESRSGETPIFALDYLTPMDAFGKKFINEEVNESTKFAKKYRFRPKELFPLTDWTRHVMTYQVGRNPDYLKHTEFRYIDNPILDIRSRIVIQEPLVRIVSIEENEMWGVVIESSALAKTWKSIYEMLWQMATPVTSETIEGWGENEFLKVEREE